MQDQLKYRVWDKQEKIMLENAGVWGTSFFVFCSDCPVDWIETVPSADFVGPGAGENWCICDEERFIFEQCTGKKDKRDNLIFDSDELRIIRLDTPGCICAGIVVWDDYSWQVEFEDGSNVSLGYLFKHPNCYEVEKVGTIHDKEQ